MVSPLMDYRSEDEAWYCVRLRLEGDTLIVMYCDFPEGSDELYSAEGFANVESAEEFLQRFRPPSSQLQDKNCDAIMKGMKVCASYRLAVDDLRFYDAVVISVNPSIHPLQEGECRCKFELLWQHGPLKDKKSILGIEHVCLIRSRIADVNVILDKFMDIVKEKVTAIETSSVPKFNTSDLNLSQHSNLHMRTSKFDGTLSHNVKGKSSREDMHDNLEPDVDMGGQSVKKSPNSVKKRSSYFCRIENLEKDLSPFAIMHFVQKNLGIRCSAFICPSTAQEFCTKGFIFLEEIQQADKLKAFLLSREYNIVSLNGRPWLINDTCFGITEVITPAYVVKTNNTSEELSVQIIMVHRGTTEYEMTEKLRLLHSEFLEYTHFRLIGRLLTDERKLMKQMAEE